MAVTRPSYFEWRAQLEAETARWRAGTLLLGLACLVLVVLLIYQAMRPTPVYFFAATGDTAVTGLARADYVPPELVDEFATQVAMVFGNLMPSTARQSYDRMRLYMTETLQRQLASRAAADLSEIEQRQLSTSFTVRRSQIVASTDKHWMVRVLGRRVSWSRGTLTSEEDIMYEFDVVRQRPNSGNPSGLAINTLSVGRPPAGG